LILDVPREHCDLDPLADSFRAKAWVGGRISRRAKLFHDFRGRLNIVKHARHGGLACWTGLWNRVVPHCRTPGARAILRTTRGD